MSLETEAVIDRRRLRRSITFWRTLAVIGLLAVVAAFAAGSGQLAGIGETRQIARVSIEGLITENRDQLRMLKRLAEAKHVQGVIVYINSGGGTTTGGEALFESLRQLSSVKPVVAQFGTVAASAAYITGLATDHIVARGNTVTGSVGVIMQWPEFSQLLDKVGVKVNEVKTGPLKANPGMFSPPDDAGQKVAKAIVDDGFQWFVSLVSSRRGISPGDVPGLMQGRVYSGREALGYKLIDEIGGEAEAIRWLEDKRGVPKKLKVVDWKPKADGGWGGLSGALGSFTAGLLGLDGSIAARVLGADGVLGRLSLDGLLSVWHPAEN